MCEHRPRNLRGLPRRTAVQTEGGGTEGKRVGEQRMLSRSQGWKVRNQC